MNSERFSDDLIIVDYTDFHQRQPDEKVPSEGVCFIDKPDNRLGAFYILNPKKHSYEAINLEANPGLVTDEQGRPVKQCECICRAERERGKRWALLLELKYCTEENIPDNMQNAFLKLDSCYDFLVRKKFFADYPYRIYWVISHPEHETIQPFSNFINNQDRLLGLNDKGINFIYSNAIKILTPKYLIKSEIPRRYQSTQP